jgi:hypothetical protein
MATFEPVAFDRCFDEANVDIARLLACPALTAADVDTLETCFDAIDALKCGTQAEADARASSRPREATLQRGRRGRSRLSGARWVLPDRRVPSRSP